MANYNNSRNYTPLSTVSKTSEKNKEMHNSTKSNPASSNPLLDLLNGSFSCNQDTVNVTSDSPSKESRTFKDSEPISITDSYSFTEAKKPIKKLDTNSTGTIFTYVDPFSLIPEDLLDSSVLNSKSAITSTPSNKKNSSLKYRSKGYLLPQKSINFEKNAFGSANQLKKIPEKYSVKILTKHNISIQKYVVSQKGFAIYSGIDGKLTASKEATSDRIQLKEHKQDVIDMTFWNPTNQDFDSEVRYVATISLDSSLLLWRFNNVVDPKKPISYTLEFGLRGNPQKGSSHVYLLVDINPANMDIMAVVTDVNEVLLIDLCSYMKPSGSIFSTEVELGNIITTVKMNKKISALSFSSSGEQLAIGDINGNIRLITLNDNSVMSSKTLSANSGFKIDYLKFTGVDNNLLIVGLDGNSLIHLWDISTQQIIQIIHIPKDRENKNHLCFESDSSILFVVANARNTLMAFQLTNYFSFFSEHVLADNLLGIDATLDISSLEEPLLKRSINLHLRSKELVKVYSIPICSFIPGETTELLTLPDSHFSEPSFFDDLLKRASNNNTLNSSNETNRQYVESTFSENETIDNQKDIRLNNTAPNSHLIDFDNISVESLFGVLNDVQEKSCHNFNHNSFKNKQQDGTVRSTKTQMLIPSSVIPTSNSRNLNYTASKTQSPRVSSKIANKFHEINGAFSSDIIDLVRQELSFNSQKVTEDITMLDSQLKSVSKLTDKLPSDLLQASSSDFASILQEVIKKELPEIIQNQFASSFNRFLESNDFESVLNGHLKHNIQNAFHSSSTIECISNTVKDKIEKKILDSLNAQTMDLIKAYNSAATVMFQQISQTFDSGLLKFQTDHESILDRQRSELARLKALLDNKDVSQSKNCATKTLINATYSSPKETFNHSVVFSKAEQNTLSLPQNNNKIGVKLDPSNLEHELNEAVSKNDIRRIIQLFSEPQSTVLLKYCEISQKNLLILTKLITKELETDTLMKLSVIEVCVDKLNPLDLETAPHVVRIMSNVKNSIKALPTDHFTLNSESSDTISKILNICSRLQSKALEVCQ